MQRLFVIVKMVRVALAAPRSWAKGNVVFHRPVGQWHPHSWILDDKIDPLFERQVFSPMWLLTITLLTISNVFMIFAWYGHLKFKSSALWLVVLTSWGIAFFEYCFQVPANRLGHGTFTAAQLKTIQEVITLTVFAVFSVTYLKERLEWNTLVGFALIALGAFFVFMKWRPEA